MTNDAEAAITHAAEEAARRGDRRIGTDHLLLGLLHDPSIGRVLGVDPDSARAAAEELDRSALAALGIHLGTMPEQRAATSARHAPLTSGFRAVIGRAVTLASVDKTRKVEPRHVLAALLERKHPDPAATLLDALDLRHPQRMIVGLEATNSGGAGH